MAMVPKERLERALERAPWRRSQKNRPCTDNAAEAMPHQVTDFWKAHNKSGRIFEESKCLSKFIFRKSKQVVSQAQMMQQLKDTLEVRQEFLQHAGLELNHVLKNKEERQEFLKFAKDKYHSDPEQKRLQERDVQEGGNKKRHARKHSRWNRELQRRCNTQ